MMNTVFIVPNKDAMVRDPETKVILLETGKAVTLLGASGRYWRRRINGGSVKIVKPSVKEKKK